MRSVESGLRLLAHTAPESQVVSAALAVRVGSRSETSRWSGLAHLAEHVACGADTPGARALASAGGTCNAVTQPDFTVYHGYVAVEHGALLLDRLLEVLTAVEVTAERVRNEVAIVADELSAAVDGAVMGGFPWLWLPAALYDEPEFAHNGYGDMASLRRVTPEVLAGFFARHYVADNAVLAVCAPDPVSLLKRVPEVRRGTPSARPDRLPEVTPGPATVLAAPEQPHQATAVAWSLPHSPLTPGHLRASVLADVLVGPDDGVLEDSLPRALELAAYVGPFADPWDVAAPLPFVVEVHHEADEDPLGVPAAVVAVLKEWDVGEDLVVAAARRMGTELRQRLADPVTLPVLSVASELVHGGVERLADAPGRLADVSPAHLRAVAGELVAAPYRVLTRGPRS
ncbi:insulinase family protein [Streptomyces sp. NPDC006132]|uniref:M16 family metallopeptidase n=1 Tax=Streptomyces sp. NPDC006132 TaxID=3156732 RepID=UPI0033E32908